jgi:hypothetical protein
MGQIFNGLFFEKPDHFIPDRLILMMDGTRNIVFIAGSHGDKALMKYIVSINNSHNFIKGYFVGILNKAETPIGALGG